MKDISYHILDVVQNSLHAGATAIGIELTEESAGDTLQLKITDNGKGMPAEVVKKVTDPFFTSSVTKRVGLGLPLLKQNAEQTGGNFKVDSDTKQGTTVNALFRLRHIDMIPAGDLALTVRMLIASNPSLDITFKAIKDEDGFEVDTATLRQELQVPGLNSRDILDFITDYIRNSLKTLSVYNN